MTRGARGNFASLLLIGLTALCGCGTALDEQRADICRRALPALVPDGVRPDIQRIGRGATSDSVRIDYRALGGAKPTTRQTWLLCRFGTGTDLVSAATEIGPVGGASLYLLKRYYLGKPDSLPIEPKR